MEEKIRIEVSNKTASEYGYGKYPDVISGLEFERLVSAGGPTGGTGLAGRRAAALRFALHLLAAHPRAFFAKAVFARLFGSHASPR